MLPYLPHPASYRDPSGFIFHHKDVLYRQVNLSFQRNYDQFISSGLYNNLIQEQLLIPHQEIEQNFTNSSSWYKTLQPEKLSFISYPFEWSFDMLKDAALLTLQLAKKAMQFGMMLKDATPYNIQLHKGKMTFIDTLSFEVLDATKPWIAYRQFCENFLAPLALMHYLKTPLHPLLLAYPEGVPLSVATKMLPFKSKFNMGCYLHLHLHASYSQSKKGNTLKSVSFSEQKLKNIFTSLENTITGFKLEYKDVWSGYYEEAAQRTDYLQHKQTIIERWLANLSQVHSAIDVGANEGMFAKMAANRGMRTIAADFDHYSINRLYQQINKENISNIFPVITDLSQPAPSIGVNNAERDSFFKRSQSDLVMALALIHHLAIGRNIPFAMIAEMFKKLGRYLIVEYVPKEDEKVMEMLVQKEDIYDWYTEENFKNSFAEHYRILDVHSIAATGRALYLMQEHDA